MFDMTSRSSRSARFAVTAASLALAGLQGPARAQGVDATVSPYSPSPYYIGASQGFTYDSNVYRTPSGQSDTYSSTSLLGGFDQRISRQRVHGRATVSLNRYFNEKPLNNTSYALAAGLDWETLYRLSGNLDVGIERRLAAPTATSGVTGSVRNLAQTEHVDARARWGGESLLTLEGTAGYSRIDYSAPQFVASESNRDYASLGLYYRPGGFLRLGAAARVSHARTPRALFDPATGQYTSNSVNGKSLDLLADYVLTGLLDTSARLSYTRQSNSTAGGADFSGLTGGLQINYRPTAKIAVSLQANRDAGFDTTAFNTFTVVQDGSTATITPVTGLYENNRITNRIGLSLSYAATAKISANVGVGYSRARLVTTIAGPSGSQSGPETTDLLRTAYIGATYAIARNWNLACNASHESRRVTGGFSFGYSADTVGCSARYQLTL